ncbi:DUF167 domain-containing protein [Candidatus Fermentibacterales bacterium]|nr:DUF167 domain-containing protein [Candidatus Fermentibacterales bacterium]
MDLRLRVKVSPRSSRTGFCGLMADGSPRIALRSAPAGGRANHELTEYIAREFGVGRNDVEIVSGLRSSRKTLLVRAPAHRPEWLPGTGEAEGISS